MHATMPVAINSNYHIESSKEIVNNDFSRFIHSISDFRGDVNTASIQYNLVKNTLYSPPYKELIRKEASEKYVSKNRPKGILPYDTNLLSSTGEKHGTVPVPYLNGSLVTLANAPHTYLALQGPLGGNLPDFSDVQLDDTVADFFNVLIENESTVIAALVMPFEHAGSVNRLREKCSPYWTQTRSLGNGFVVHAGREVALDTQIAEKIEIANSKWGTQEGLVVRDIVVSKDGQHFSTIRQFHYQNWPDHGAANPDIYFLYEALVNEKIADDRASGKKGAPAVHCSAGCGRTGTYILTRLVRDYIEAEQQKGKSLDQIKINLPAMLLQLNFGRRLLSSEPQYNAVLQWIADYVQQVNLGK